VPESGDTVNVDNRRKHLTILKNLYSGDRVLVSMAKKAAQKFEEDEYAAFNAFQVDVGNLFLELKEELDQGLEDLADRCPEEPNPALWDEDDWVQFYVAVAGHKFEDIYLKMAKRQPNIDLIWKELDNRLDLP
jgi:hypothetical protein